MTGFSELLPDFRATDLVDVAIVAALLYVLLLAFKQTRTTFVGVGFAILTTLYGAAVAFDLRLTRYLVQLVFAVAFLALIVMFHEELRASAERFLSWRGGWRRAAPAPGASSDTIDTLVDTLAEFAHDRVGALVVLLGRDNPARFIRGGFGLDGQLSEALLKSIFDPHSIGHDGAVVLAGDRIRRFACHLPLSTDASKVGKRGTRHAAALGLSERTDCLCLAVSEERGTITIARHGELEQVDDLGRLSQLLNDFRRETGPVEPRRSWTSRPFRNLRLKAASVAGAALLWFLVVHEGSTAYRSFLVDVTPIVQGSRTIGLIAPARVQVIVSGPRRRFYWTDGSDFHVNPPLLTRTPGKHDIYLTATDVELPEGLVFVNLVPRNIIVTIDG